MKCNLNPKLQETDKMDSGKRSLFKGANIKLLVLIFLSFLVFIIIVYLAKHIRTNKEPIVPMTPKTVNPLYSLSSITPIRHSEHFMVSAFVDHRINKAIRVISIFKRDSLQPLNCIYCNKNNYCQVTSAKIEIHEDHFNFPFGATDVLCQSDFTEQAERVVISTHDNISKVPVEDYLPVRNNIERESFKFTFTVCISSLFGGYNNVLQFAQTMEMYKLLGVQHVVIYNTSCGPELEKLLQHYQREGILEIVSWPINQFLTPSNGWNYPEHKGDLHYYGQIVKLNECIYRHMYQSKYLLLNDIDEIIMPYKHNNLHLLMEDLQSEHKNVGVFVIENHIFPKTQFEESGRFKLPEWRDIPGINIMEHIYREPDRKNVFHPAKMIINPRNVQQTSVHSTMKHFGDRYWVPLDICRIVHVRVPLQGALAKEQLFVDTRVWDFKEELIPNVNRALNLSGLLKSPV